MNKKPMTIGGLPVPEVKTHPDTGDESSLSGMPCSAKIAMDETILYAAMHSAALTDMDHENAPYGEGDLVALWLHQNEMKHIVRSTVRELHKRGRFLS